jgi:hypothetical protein
MPSLKKILTEVRCNQCGATFHTQKELNEHYATHDKDKAESKFQIQREWQPSDEITSRQIGSAGFVIIFSLCMVGFGAFCGSLLTPIGFLAIGTLG